MIRSLCVAAIAGAVVMALEILASRWLSPAYGFTLTTWSLLIATTLLAGSLGAAFGALFSRGASWVRVKGLLLVAGVWAGLCAFLAPFAVDAFLDRPVLEGALLATLIILPVPVICLGAVVPLLGQLRAGASEPGRLVGLLIAASTVGSLVGTLATALWSIPTFGLRMSAVFASMLLIGPGVLLEGKRSSVAGVAAGAALVLAHLLAPHPADDVELTRNTPYGRLTIERTPSGRGIFVDGIAQARETAHVRGPGALIVARQYVELLPYMRPSGRTALNIGLGTGIVPSALGAYEIDVESVDVNPVLVDVVRQQFGFEGIVHVGDGRAVWRRMDRRFDFVVLDAFQGEVLPGHLVTSEAFQELRERLTPNGIVCLHLIGRPRHAVTSALAKAMDVFVNVRCAQSGLGDELQDLFLFASDGPLNVPPAEELRRAGWLGNEWFEPQLDDVALITDDRNPIDVLNEPLGREVRLRSRR